jgi:hypothetical protein
LPGIKLGANVIADPDLESAGDHNVTKFGLFFWVESSKTCSSVI